MPVVVGADPDPLPVPVPAPELVAEGAAEQAEGATN